MTVSFFTVSTYVEMEMYAKKNTLGNNILFCSSLRNCRASAKTCKR